MVSISPIHRTEYSTRAQSLTQMRHQMRSRGYTGGGIVANIFDRTHRRECWRDRRAMGRRLATGFQRAPWRLGAGEQARGIALDGDRLPQRLAPRQTEGRKRTGVCDRVKLALVGRDARAEVGDRAERSCDAFVLNPQARLFAQASDVLESQTNRSSLDCVSPIGFGDAIGMILTRWPRRLFPGSRDGKSRADSN